MCVEGKKQWMNSLCQLTGHLPTPGYVAIYSDLLVRGSYLEIPSVSLLLILATASSLIPIQRRDSGTRGKGMESKYLRPDYPTALLDLLLRLWSENDQHVYHLWAYYDKNAELQAPPRPAESEAAF